MTQYSDGLIQKKILKSAELNSRNQRVIRLFCAYNFVRQDSMNSLNSNGIQKTFSLLFKQHSIKNALQLQQAPLIIIPSRNTFILKRRYPVKLARIGDSMRKLKGKDFVYDFVEHQDSKKKPDIEVILNEYIEGIGNKGDVVLMPRYTAYNKLLVTGLADFPSPEAIERAKSRKKSSCDEVASSLIAPLAVKYLEKFVLTVIMNNEVEWILEPWHLKVAFRKAGIHVPEKCIELPSKPIKGPNPNLESKVFCITVTINNKDKATVRCILSHWNKIAIEGAFWSQKPWLKPYEYIFPEDAEKISKLPEIKYKSIQDSPEKY